MGSMCMCVCTHMICISHAYVVFFNLLVLFYPCMIFFFIICLFMFFKRRKKAWTWKGGKVGRTWEKM